MKRLLLCCAFFAVFAQAGRAEDAAITSEQDREQIRSVVREVLREYASTLGNKQVSADAKGVIGNIVKDNAAFVRSHKAAYFAPFVDGQHPRATVVTCSDSRVHMHALDNTPDNDLFVIRDIGNQIQTAEGSVEYGVRHLHTPVLLIVGHSACGAIQAASGNYSSEPPSIRRELDTIQIPQGDASINSVKLNVHKQVRYAMNKFEPEVLSGKLTVVGAVYDFRNDMGNGQGMLNIINVNGETDPANIAALDLMKGAGPAPKGHSTGSQH